MQHLKSLCAAALAGVASLSFCTLAAGQEIPYTPSAVSGISPNSQFPLSEINDNITADVGPGFNGFVSRTQNGTIKLQFSNSYDLSGMKLWNDVNVRREGVKNFTLNFFDSSGNSVGTYSAAAPPDGQIVEGSYFFNASDVNYVEMQMTAKDGFGIEIRELKFFGRPGGKRGITDFSCYDLMAHEKETYNKQITITDQFGKSRSVMGHAVALCNPAGINSERFNPRRHQDHLVCYEVYDEKSERRPKYNVQIKNQIESNRLVTAPIDEVCLVSAKKHLDRPRK